MCGYRPRPPLSDMVWTILVGTKKYRFFAFQKFSIVHHLLHWWKLLVRFVSKRPLAFFGCFITWIRHIWDHEKFNICLFTATFNRWSKKCPLGGGSPQAQTVAKLFHSGTKLCQTDPNSRATCCPMLPSHHPSLTDCSTLTQQNSFFLFFFFFLTADYFQIVLLKMDRSHPR